MKNLGYWMAGNLGGSLLDGLLATVRVDVRNDAAWRAPLCSVHEQAIGLYAA